MKTLNTIAWQRRQLNNVRITLAVLLNKGVIKTTLTKEKATKKYVRDLNGRLEAIVDKVKRSTLANRKGPGHALFTGR